MAACGFVQATEGLAAAEPEAMARIVEGVITGIGFIGGGAILKGGARLSVPDMRRGMALSALDLLEGPR